MYAVIETGGKQYRVEVGTELEVELLDVEPGQAITIDRVLLVADGAEAAVGRPIVSEAAVDAEVVRRERGDKLIAFKYRPKARRRVKKGHRQELTVLRIADIRFNGKSAADAQRRAEEDAKSERQRIEEAAARQAAADAALAASLSKRSEPHVPAKRGRAKATRTPEPGTGTAEPGTGTPEPGTGTAEPGTGTADSTAREPAEVTGTEAPSKRTRAEAAEAGQAAEESGAGAADATGTGELSDKPAPKRPRAKKDE